MTAISQSIGTRFFMWGLLCALCLNVRIGSYIRLDVVLILAGFMIQIGWLVASSRAKLKLRFSLYKLWMLYLSIAIALLLRFYFENRGVFGSIDGLKGECIGQLGFWAVALLLLFLADQSNADGIFYQALSRFLPVLLGVSVLAALTTPFWLRVVYGLVVEHQRSATGWAVYPGTAVLGFLHQHGQVILLATTVAYLVRSVQLNDQIGKWSACFGMLAVGDAPFKTGLLITAIVLLCVMAWPKAWLTWRQKGALVLAFLCGVSLFQLEVHFLSFDLDGESSFLEDPNSFLRRRKKEVYSLDKQQGAYGNSLMRVENHKFAFKTAGFLGVKVPEHWSTELYQRGDEVPTSKYWTLGRRLTMPHSDWIALVFRIGWGWLLVGLGLGVFSVFRVRRSTGLSWLFLLPLLVVPVISMTTIAPTTVRNNNIVFFFVIYFIWVSMIAKDFISSPSAQRKGP